MSQVTVVQIVELLVSNGVAGENSRAALAQLAQYKADPTFVTTLSHLVGTNVYPVDPAQLSPMAQQCGWDLIRGVAAWALKTCISPSLPYEACAAAAGAAVTVIQEAGAPRRLTSAAAVVIARLTAAHGVQWWSDNGIDLANMLLTDMLGSADADRVVVGLRCLQYLVEDAANSMGHSIGTIVQHVASCATNRPEIGVRCMALHVLQAIMNFGNELDWSLENLSDAQKGLVEGVPHVALTSAGAMQTMAELTDEAAVHVFQIAEMLVDYHRALGRSQVTAPHLGAIFGQWAQTAYTAIANRNTLSVEIVTAACVYVSHVFSVCDSTGADGPVAAMCEAFSPNLEQLTSAVLACIVMSQEEEAAMLATDNYDVRDPHQRRRPNRRKLAADEKEDKKSSSSIDDDDDCAEASLRNQACITLEMLAIAEPERVAAHVIQNIQNVFSSSDWRTLECGICALGSIYDGAQNQLIPYAESLIPEIGRLIGDGNPGPHTHVGVISIALWALGKFSEWAMTQSEAMYDNIIAAATPCLTSLSKRVQNAAVTFFRNTVNLCLAIDPQNGGPFAKHVMTIATKFHTCLPVYHSKNLRMLCYVSRLLLPVIPYNLRADFLPPFANELQVRLPRLSGTMQERYVNGNITVTLDVDCIYIGGFLADAYAMLDLDEAIFSAAAGDFATWVQVIKFALTCNVQEDDTMVFDSSMRNITQLISCIDDGSLTNLLTQNNNEVVSLAVQLASTVDDSDLASAVAQLLQQLLVRFGPEAVPDVDTMVRMLQGFGPVSENCGLVADGSLLVHQMFQSCQPTPALEQYAAALASQVRGDAIDNDMMILLAECIGGVMVTRPEIFALASATETALALRKAQNDQFKADATAGVLAVIGGHASSNQCGQAELAQATAAAVSLASSWQKESSNFEGLVQAISIFFQAASQHPVMQQTLGNEINERRMPQKAIKSLRSLYQF